MISGLIGKKLEMTQIFDRDGNVVPVTVIEAGPCFVLRTLDKPMKVVVGFGSAKESRLNKPNLGYFKKLGVAPLKVIKEFRSSDNKDYKVGQEIKADLFKAGDFVDVTGVSIGKGFQGGMKRWNWSGGPGGHGSMHHRRVGSIGASSDPSRVLVGTHMPGHMGLSTVTVQGLRVMEVDAENNVVLLKGAVPGHTNGIVTIQKSRKKVFKALDEVKVAVEKKKKNPLKQSKTKATGKGK